MLKIAVISKDIEKKNEKAQEKLLSLQQSYNLAALRPRCNIVCSEAGGIIKISLYDYGDGTITINHLDITN